MEPATRLPMVKPKPPAALPAAISPNFVAYEGFALFGGVAVPVPDGLGGTAGEAGREDAEPCLA